MTAYIGRKVTLTWGGVTIGGVRVKIIALGGAPIDITDVSDSGWQELIQSDLAQYDVKLTVTGLAKDAQLKSDWFSGPGGTTFAKTLVLTYPDGHSISGTFVIAAYSEGQDYKTAVTFSCEFMSTTAVTWT